MALAPNDHDLRIDSPWSIGERSGLILLIVLVPAILVLDFVAGRGISLHLFYLVPVALAAWNLGARAGYAVSATAACAWAFVAIASRTPGAGWALVTWDVLSTFALYLFVGHLVVRHRGFVEGVRTYARVDGDTGALSRREFDRILEAEVRRSGRYRRPVALVLFDLPETRGGASFLPAVVRTMQSLVRECDSVSRISAKRFALILVECKPPEPLFVAERLRDALVGSLKLRKPELAIAIATYAGREAQSPAGLLALAENHINLARSGSGVAEVAVD